MYKEDIEQCRRRVFKYPIELSLQIFLTDVHVQFHHTPENLLTSYIEKKPETDSNTGQSKF